jgi:hypothetical protein
MTCRVDTSHLVERRGVDGVGEWNSSAEADGSLETELAGTLFNGGCAVAKAKKAAAKKAPAKKK